MTRNNSTDPRLDRLKERQWRDAAIRKALSAFANHIADEIDRRIAMHNGATASALAEVAEVVREAGRQA